MALPGVIKAEVKFTTGTVVQLPARELEALQDPRHLGLGLVAVLFWCSDPEVDGRWLVRDASELRARRSARTVSVSKDDLRRAERMKQPRLQELRQHLRRSWPRFLQAFLEEAVRGHLTVGEELQRCHRERKLAERLPRYEILEADHQRAMTRLIEAQGESAAGRVLQDLFAYVVALLGYCEVTLNAVGVPDVTLAGLDGLARDREPVGGDGSFSPEELQRLERYCREAGDEELAGRIRDWARRVGKL